MSSLLTSGISRCGMTSGRLKKLFVANYTDLTGSLIIDNNIVNDISKTLAWYEFDVSRGNAEADEKAEDSDNGVRYIQQVKYNIIQVESEAQERFTELVRGRFIILYQDTNSKWFLIGLRGAEVKGYDSKIGGGNNEYSFTFVANDFIPKFEVLDSYYQNNILRVPCDESGIYTDDVLTLEVPLWQVLNCNVYP